MGIKSKLFKDFKGCTNGDCIIHDVKGMMTNGSCSCLHSLSRWQLHILKSRLQSLDNDNRLNDNFETALKALIKHHGKDSIDTFCAVMKHFDIDSEALKRGIFTANDIKPEK